MEKQEVNMNESDMPREWWHDQDQDEAWVKQQEEEMRRREEEERNAPVQLELPLFEIDIDEGPFVPVMPMRSK